MRRRLARATDALASNRRETWAALALVALVVPFLVDAFYFRIAFLVIMWSGLAVSWNIVGGYIRYPSFGHVAFFALGGFTVGLGAQYFGIGDSFGLELLGTLLLAGLVPTAVAALVAYPILRLRGAYFGVTTLGIALVLRELFTAFEVLGGGLGIVAPTFETPVVETRLALYYLMLGVVACTVAVASGIRDTRLGYGFGAIRENEDAAEMLGIPTTRYKVIAFLLSAFFPGVIGGLYVYYLGYFTAGTMFALEIGVDMIIYTVIGGIGTVAGPIIGTAIMVVLKYVVLSDLLQVHVLVTGVFIVVAMLFFPDGIVGLLEDLRERESGTDHAGGESAAGTEVTHDRH